ncbi:MAG TPA: hypothetical protein GXZ28_01335 [Clostridiales bacterium]|nr:hypothetical protein [Clostridiales bacterium]
MKKKTNYKNNFLTNFLICGLCGWCMECFWTGLGSIKNGKDRTLSCHTSVWMFPIYGMAACLSPICDKLKERGVLCRGGIYALLIFITEFITGIILKKHKACPWDYSKAKLNYKGVIRLDYAPLWFLAGLFFEKILCSQREG